MSRLLKTLRYMAWQRAKGELESILDTYWEDQDHYEEVKQKVRAFTAEMDDIL